MSPLFQIKSLKNITDKNTKKVSSTKNPRFTLPQGPILSAADHKVSQSHSVGKLPGRLRTSLYITHCYKHDSTYGQCKYK